MEFNAEIRKQKHLAAKHFLEAGKPRVALELMEKCLKEHGAHVGLLSDIAACNYHLQNFSQWREQNVLLKQEFKECRNFLSPTSRVRTLICLGKFSEEDGRVTEALQLYKQALADAQQDANLRLKVIIQMVRLLATFNSPDENLAQHYSELLHLGQTEFGTQFDLEVEHTLFLAELELFNETIPRARLERILKNGSSQDQKLCLFDLAEWSLLRKLKIPEDLRKHLSSDSTQDPFENCLLDFVQEPNEEFLVQKILERSGQLLTASYLRILSIGSILIVHESLRKNLESRFLFALRSLHPADRKHWTKRLARISKTYKFSLNLDARTIHFGEHRMDLSKRSNLFELLKMLVKERSMTTEEATSKVWKTNYDWHAYNRLRVFCQRSNKIFEESFGVGSIFIFDQNQISLNTQVQIEIQGYGR